MFNAPKQNCMRNLERFRQSSILSKNPSALFPPKPSINLCHRMHVTKVILIYTEESKHDFLVAHGVQVVWTFTK